MKQSLIATVLLVPAILSAQVGAKGQASSRTSVAASAPNPQASVQARAHANANASFSAPERFSAEGKAKLEAEYAETRKRGLPPEAVARRVAEGEAKGASEASIIAAAGKVRADMESTQEAMVAAGHPKPSAEECERGALLMARGVTSAQIETMARHTPSERSLVVAFDVVSRLAAQGVPVTQALTRVQAKIDGRASDAALIKLAGNTTAGVGIGVGSTATGRSATGTANAAAQGTANAATKGTAAGVTGTVTGVIRKP